jgi:rare lipoprotein A
VRVNDRGPFHENRLIDLSYAAAVKIGIWPKGTGMVQVDAIDPEHPRAARPAPRAMPGARIHLQLGAFGERSNAEALVRRARRAGIEALHIETTDAGGRTLHRVRSGPLADAHAADELGRRIEQAGLGVPAVIIEP